MQPELSHHPGHALAVEAKVIYSLLKNREIFLILEAAANSLPIQHAVRLGARGTHRRPLAGIEDAKLDSGLVGGGGHCATERVHFLDQVPLADSTDGRIAGHLAKGFDIVGQQQRAATRPGRRQGGLGAGVSAAHHDDFERIGVFHCGAGKEGRIIPESPDTVDLVGLAFECST